MKSYNEIAENVFRRRDEYNAKRSRRIRRLTAVSSAAACLGLAAAIGVGVQRQSGMTQPPVSQPAAGAAYGTAGGSQAAAKDTSQPELPRSDTSAQAEREEAPAEEDFIFINSYDGDLEDNGRRYDLYALMLDNFTRMTEEELCEYYGTNVFPEVPEDLSLWSSVTDGGSYGIYRREDGEIYHDQNVINYSNLDDAMGRSINIEVAKGRLPFSCVGFFEYDCMKPSVIGGEEVYMAESGTYYYAEFMHDNVGFRLIIHGLSEEEIVSVISSLIGEE